MYGTKLANGRLKQWHAVSRVQRSTNGTIVEMCSRAMYVGKSNRLLRRRTAIVWCRRWSITSLITARAQSRSHIRTCSTPYIASAYWNFERPRHRSLR